MDIFTSQSSQSENHTPIDIQPDLHLNVTDEEQCASIDFRSEILSGVKSWNTKLYEYKIRLKDLVSKIDKLTMSTHTLMKDDKISEENVIFVNEIKDTGKYLIKMGKTFHW